MNTVEYGQVQEIYDRFVKVNDCNDYRNMYVPLPMEKNNRIWKWEGKDFPRVIALLEFEKYVTLNKLKFEHAMCINGDDDPEYEYVDCARKTVINYKDDPIRHDLHTLDIECSDFDFAMLNQTIEHIYDPIRCLTNICAHMRKGGIIYANVPVINSPHDVPYHYYTGIQPVGLGIMVHLAGFEILSIGQWGNLEYLNILFNVPWWADYRMMKNPGLNDFTRPVITWCFARKV